MTGRFKTKMKLEELKKHPYPLIEIVNNGGSAHSIINKIVDLTNETYEDLAKVIDLSRSQVARIKRDPDSVMKEANLANLIREFNLPAKKLFYTNSMISAKKYFTEEDLISPDDAIQAQTEKGEYHVLDYVRIDYNIINEAKTTEERAYLIKQNATYSIVQLDYAPIKEKSNRLYVRQIGSHMMSPPQINQKSIPDNAIIEVEVVPESEINDGEMVFVQIGEEWATCYIYIRKEHVGKGVIEQFRTVNPDYPLRTIAMPQESDNNLDEKRIIIGRAKCIVHYNLQS